jgi:hypothetical protein
MMMAGFKQEFIMIERVRGAAEQAGHALRIAAIGGLSALALAGCGESGIHSRKAARAVAAAKFDSTYDGASPAGKYMLQFLRATQIDIMSSNNGGFNLDSNHGTSSYDQFFFGSACLQNTAYDTAGGEINVQASASGFLNSSSASANGNIPTAAAYADIDPKNPDDLIIESGHANSINLTFSGIEGDAPLQPANTQTKNVLATYGCESGIPITFSFLDDTISGGYTAPYVK